MIRDVVFPRAMFDVQYRRKNEHHQEERQHRRAFQRLRRVHVVSLQMVTAVPRCRHDDDDDDDDPSSSSSSSSSLLNKTARLSFADKF
jgi:hypothetical protein